jgi:hypothetical protein
MATHTADKKVNLLKSIFEKNVLRFSSPLSFNDPFELRPHIKKMINEEKHILQDAVFKHLNITEQAHKFHDITVTTLAHDIGMLCLSGLRDNLVMWGNYADNHKGIVIEFDDSHPFFNPDCEITDFIHELKEVVYVDERISMNSDEWGANEKTFLAKGKDWKYEYEYRMTILLEENDRNPNRFNIKFPSEIITAVYIGCKATQDTKKYVNNLSSKKQWKHLKIHQYEADEKEYKLTSKK